MNDELTAQYLREIVGNFSFSKRLLIWDSFKAYITDSTKQVLKYFEIEAVIVPSGCTGYVQALDVIWNKPFKIIITEVYDEWLASGVHIYTAAGNVRHPTPKTTVEWVLQSLSQLSNDMIQESFKCCGITIAPDGSED